MKLTKKLISLAVSVAVIASSLIFVLPANAQALAQNVYMAFTDTDQLQGDYIMVNSSGYIQDSSLSITLYNESEQNIVISGITSNGTVNFSNYIEDKVVEVGQPQKFGISGKVTVNDVFSVTVFYRVEGNPASTEESVTAYIYAKTETNTSVTMIASTPSGFGSYGATSNITLAPLTSGSVSNNDSATASVNATIYVDGSIYTTWQDFNLQFKFDPDYDLRDHYELWGFNATLSNTTGSFGTVSADYVVPNEEGVTSFEWNTDTKTGYFVNIASTAVAVDCLGAIPTAATTTIKTGFTLYGLTGGIVGGVVGVFKSKAVTPTFNITVYNNNKAALRSYLTDLASLGLNQGSYTTSSWNNYATYLKAAYVQLGKNQTTAANVANALSRVKSAYNSLVRYDTVVTNHYFYTDAAGTEKTLIKSDYDMKVTDGSTFTPSVISANEYVDYNYNRSTLAPAQVIKGSEENNYLTVIDQYYWKVDTTALEAAIKRAGQMGTNGQNLDKEGNPVYTDDSWATFSSALTGAKETLADLTLFQASIDEATKALERATDRLVRLNINTNYLDAGIGWAEAIIYTEETGEQDLYYDFTEAFDILGRDWTVATMFPSSALYANYTAMKDEYNKSVALEEANNYTASEIKEQGDRLWNAIYNLKIADENGLTVSGKRYADKKLYGYYVSRRDSYSDSNGLEKLFDDITDKTSGTYQLEQSDFTEDSWYNLQSALYGYSVADGASIEDGVFNEMGGMTDDYDSVDAGCSVWQGNDPYVLNVPAYAMIHNICFFANQQDMDSCRDNLLAKVSELEYVIDTSDIDALLEEAATWSEENATLGSLTALNSAVSYANELLAKATENPYYGHGISQKELDKCIPGLISAINSMVDISELRAAVDELHAVADPEKYTQSSIAQFNEALAEYEALYSSDSGQTTINQAVVSVQDCLLILHEIPRFPVDVNFAGAVSLANNRVDGIGTGNTVANVVGMFDGGQGEVRIVNHSGETVAEDTPVATGFKIIVSRDGEDYDAFTFVISGDVNGDANSTSADVDLTLDHYLGDRQLSGVYLLAADVNKDGKVDLTDIALILIRC